MATVFERLIAGELPSAKVWVDDDLVVFLDNAPVNLGHCLIVTRVPYPDILEVPDPILQKILPLAKALGQALVDLGYRGFNIHQSNRPEARQDILHCHVHVWPRKHRDEVRFVFEDEPEYAGTEMSDWAARLASAVSDWRPQGS